MNILPWGLLWFKFNFININVQLSVFRLLSFPFPAVWVYLTPLVRHDFRLRRVLLPLNRTQFTPLLTEDFAYRPKFKTIDASQSHAAMIPFWQQNFNLITVIELHTGTDYSIRKLWFRYWRDAKHDDTVVNALANSAEYLEFEHWFSHQLNPYQYTSPGSTWQYIMTARGCGLWLRLVLHFEESPTA